MKNRAIVLEEINYGEYIGYIAYIIRILLSINAGKGLAKAQT